MGGTYVFIGTWPPLTHTETQRPLVAMCLTDTSPTVCVQPNLGLCVCEGIFPGFWTPSDWHKWVRDRPPYRSKHVYVFLCSSYSSPTPPQLILRVIFFFKFPNMFRKRQWHHIVPPTMQGRQGELEVGGPADKRRSNRSQFIFLCLPRLDDGVRRGPWKRKEKDEKRGRKNRLRWRRGGRCPMGLCGLRGQRK